MRLTWSSVTGGVSWRQAVDRRLLPNCLTPGSVPYCQWRRLFGRGQLLDGARPFARISFGMGKICSRGNVPKELSVKKCLQEIVAEEISPGNCHRRNVPKKLSPKKHHQETVFNGIPPPGLGNFQFPIQENWENFHPGNFSWQIFTWNYLKKLLDFLLTRRLWNICC